MFDKFKQNRKKPTRIFVSPSRNVAQLFTEDDHRKATEINGHPKREIIIKEVGCDSPQDDMLSSLRRKSKTEPAIVLSKYRNEDKKNDKPIDENQAVDSKQIQDRFSFGAFSGEVESVLLAGTIGSIASFSGSKLFSTVVDDADKVDTDIFNNFEFPITNLVFEGGGNKGMAYVGAIQVSYHLTHYNFIEKKQ